MSGLLSCGSDCGGDGTVTDRHRQTHTHTHIHLTYLCLFIPTVVFVLGNLLLQPFSLVCMNTSTKHNQAGWPPNAGTRVCEEVLEDLSVCVPFAFSFMQYISLSAAGPS